MDFDDLVTELRALRQDVNDGFARLERLLEARSARTVEASTGSPKVKCAALAKHCKHCPEDDWHRRHLFAPGERACPRCGAARERCHRKAADGERLCSYHLTKQAPSEVLSEDETRALESQGDLER